MNDIRYRGHKCAVLETPNGSLLVLPVEHDFCVGDDVIDVMGVELTLIGQSKDWKGRVVAVDGTHIQVKYEETGNLRWKKFTSLELIIP